MKVHRRTAIWLGDDDDTEVGAFTVGTEDSYVSVSMTDGAGDEVEVFIQPVLFAEIRKRMDQIEAWQ